MGVVPHANAATKAGLLLCLACSAYVVYYVLVVVRKPRVVCRTGHVRRFLCVQMEGFVKGYFRTPVWCIGADLQRLVGCLYHWWLPRVNYRRELLVLSDRGLVALDWLNEEARGPVVLVLVAGGYTDSQSRPWRSLLPALAALDFPCVVVNGRGCGGEPLTTHRITNAASVRDFAEVVKKVRQRYPRTCLLGVGMSLGGLLLCRYLCQRGPRAQLDAALAVSPPFQPVVAARALANPWGFNRLLNACITRGLVGRLRDNEDVVRASRAIRADHLFRCWTLASFYRRYAAPSFRFQSLPDFYENCSLKGKLCMVQRPLVFLVSEDDSLNPETALPEDEVLKSPWLGAVVTPRGGHMGFVDGWLLPRQPFYAERFVVAFAVGLRKVCKARGVRVLQTLGD
ncbi:protein ABHD1-like [Amblyomma americanum]